MDINKIKEISKCKNVQDVHVDNMVVNDERQNKKIDNIIRIIAFDMDYGICEDSINQYWIGSIDIEKKVITCWGKTDSLLEAIKSL